jgi:hypothetical protein
MSLNINQSLIYGLTTKLEGFTTEDENIKNRLNTIEGDETVTGSVAKALLDAKTHANDNKLDKAQNLADVADVPTARINLEVYSKNEIDSKIANAKTQLGTNWNVADIAERDAMTDLNVGDVVMVMDDGDGKWAKYEVTSLEDTTPSFTKIADKDGFENANSAGQVKVAYESNDDTNAYTDADKATVGHITATKDINLDDIASKVLANEELNHLDFANDEQVAIESGSATLTKTPLNGKVWGVMIIDPTTDTIVGLPKGSDLSVTGASIGGLSAYNGKEIRVTYAFAK